MNYVCLIEVFSVTHEILLYFSPKDIPKLVEQMIGYKLVTKQTPKGGVTVNKVS